MIYCMKKAKLSLSIVKTEIADRILSRLIPMVFLLEGVNILAVLLFAFGQWERIIVPLLALFFLIPSFYLHRKRRMKAASVLFISAVLLSISAGVLSAGGVHAPIYVGILVLPAFVTVIFDLKGGMLTSAVLVLLGIGSIIMEKTGLLPAIQNPSSLYLLSVYSLWLVFVLIIVWFTVKSMTNALKASEEERMKTEEAVKEATATWKELEKFKSLVEQIREDIVITDSDSVIEYVNPCFERTTGYSKKEVIGKKITMLKSGKHDESFYKDLDETVRSGKTWRNKVWIKLKDGRIILQDVTITPVIFEDGESHSVSFRKDITNEIKIRDMMMQSEKMMAVGGLAAGIAHEINNPLTIILQLSQNIKRRMAPELKKNLEAAEEAGAFCEVPQLTILRENNKGVKNILPRENALKRL